MSGDRTIYDGVRYRRPADARRAQAADELADLKAQRGSGVQHVRFGDREVWFRSDTELRDAILALQAELSPSRPHNVQVRPTRNRGW